MTDAPGSLPTILDVRAAAERIAGRAVRTPLLEAPLLNRAAGRRVLVKAEPLQRTGSFKFRGAWSHLSTLDAATRARGVVAYSSGNHAQGVAAAAGLLGIRAVIVMPADAPALKRANTEALGAEVVSYDRTAGESREAVGARLIAEQGLHLVKPFDDPLVMAGQGTVGLEIAEQARAAGVEEAEVFVCCGGGGLCSGVALALEAEAPGMRVRPVEPEGFDDWARSQAAGSIQRNATATGSICDAILTDAPGELPWAVGRRLFGSTVVLPDRDARRAMAAAARHLKLVVEPGGSVGVAAALFHAPPGDQPVIAVASGGNVDLADYARWIQFDDWTDEGLPI